MAVLVGKQAPDFTAAAVLPNGDIVEDFNLRTYLDGAYGLVFFYPLDFTFVCPSEILAYSNRVPKFEAMGVKVVAISVDSQYTHAAWRNTAPNDGGLGPVKFPMVSDMTKQIARDYDVLIEKDGVALRGTFLIDRQGVVRHQLVNDLPLGRNADEALRMADALQFHEEHGEVCPAGWQKGQEAMVADATGVAKYLGAHAEAL
ncbi:MAG: alkyl hydroperoxide reductase [Alphaproteobacteria bacterium HGW-Alphaproteobacteria-11]|nr:MAG: alkyl hydroperoxide reductase [Alphaproteobacteria bacterium HGW-Alphaproteobacteria-11]